MIIRLKSYAYDRTAAPQYPDWYVTTIWDKSRWYKTRFNDRDYHLEVDDLTIDIDEFAPTADADHPHGMRGYCLRRTGSLQERRRQLRRITHDLPAVLLELQL